MKEYIDKSIWWKNNADVRELWGAVFITCSTGRSSYRRACGYVMVTRSRSTLLEFTTIQSGGIAMKSGSAMHAHGVLHGSISGEYL